MMERGGGGYEERRRRDRSDLADAGVGEDVVGDGRGRLSGGRDVALALVVREEAGVGRRERARARERVGDARAREGGRALGLGPGRRREEPALLLEQRRRDRVKVVALGDDLRARLDDVEAVAVDVLEQVVDRVQQDRAADLRAAATRVVDVVAGEGDEVGRAQLSPDVTGASALPVAVAREDRATHEVDRPVVLAVAHGRPRRLAVKFGVADGHAPGRFVPGGQAWAETCVRTTLSRLESKDHAPADEHLAADERHLDVVDPDEVAAVEGDGVCGRAARGISTCRGPRVGNR